MNQKSGLGRGLGSLLSSQDIFDAEAPGFFLCPIERIRPNPMQPRRNIRQESLKGLAASIKAKGVLQPLVVTEEDGFYQIIAGERRWRAAQKAGLKKVPVVLRDADRKDVLELALIENIQREDLNPVEEALAYRRFSGELGLSQAQIAERVGKDRSTIANLLRLLNLPEDILQDIADERITTGHAKAILMLEGRKLQGKLRDQIIKRGLSVRQAEELARRLKEAGPAKGGSSQRDPDMEYLCGELSRIVGARVNIVHGKRGGRLEIRCGSRGDLDRLISLLKSLEE